MTLQATNLDDKYTKDTGRIYLSGIQALVRLPLLQKKRDQAAGLNTAGFISGYRGSPLGGYDTALWSARKFLLEHKIHFEPGLNEDLAATALWGTQQVTLFPRANVEGVFGIWYGKGPGVARSMDVFKHANLAGSSKFGGVIAVAGDDHECQSSSLPHQSEHEFISAMMPVLNPSNVQEILEFGLMGFALSRYSGCWVGIKTVAETVETSASVSADFSAYPNVIPVEHILPQGGVGIRLPDPPLEKEARLHRFRMDAVAAYARANRFDKAVFDVKNARLGIVASGKTFSDVEQALANIGISASVAASLGIRLYKIGLTWPIEQEGILRFAEGLDEILVVEEKRPILEEQIIQILYNRPAHSRPRVVGKRDIAGRELVPSYLSLNPSQIADIVGSRLASFEGIDAGIFKKIEEMREASNRGAETATKKVRLPYFCSGCPHNISTKLPAGSRGMAGIGCHGMVQWMPERNTNTTTHMGGEGLTWVGQAPFTSEKHVFQNLGDGTYTHSGTLAIRAAAASGVNITYKILYNDAVAMTGGQPLEGQLTVPQIARQVAAEGAKRVVVVTDEPEKYGNLLDFPKGTDVYHRDALDAVQRELRDTSGLTVLIYDQTCAAEKRRRRKRGKFPDPQKRLFINDTVCEGCGDCSEQSHCISVKPLETDLGRKRVIDQSSCNKDFSCVNGFCPSFVTVKGGQLRSAARAQTSDPTAAAARLPLPDAVFDGTYNILITGIGGTGVVTISQVLGMAAHLESKGCTTLDLTGLAQKNGAVQSRIRIAKDPSLLHASRIAAGGANLIIACDVVVANGKSALSTICSGKTVIVANGDQAPTADFVTNGDVDFQGDAMRQTVEEVAGRENAFFIDATSIATALTGDSIATNFLMLGYAFQRGLVPLSFEAICNAIQLNGGPVAGNLATFAWGRLAFADMEFVKRSASVPSVRTPNLLASVDEVISQRAALLTDYQGANYSKKFLDFVRQVRMAEETKTPGHSDLTMQVAKSLSKLMAYKDEYEVARLYTNGEFRKKLNAQFAGKFHLQLSLAPPLLMRRDKNSGAPKKMNFGPWIFPLLRLLAWCRGLRGTWVDPFGHTRERRMERRLVVEYQDLIRQRLSTLSPQSHAATVRLAAIPEQIRGFGHVKQKSVERAYAQRDQILQSLSVSSTALAAE